MLKVLALATYFISTAAFACWQITGSLAIDGEVHKFSQKVTHQKEYLFGLGSFVLKFTLVPHDKTHTTIKYHVEEKQGLKMVTVTKGQEKDLKLKEARDIFAKGEEGQPNTILTVTLRKI